MLKTFGKVAGGIGLLLTLTSFVTIFVATPTAFFAKLGVGVAMLIFWGVTNGERLTSWARSVFFFGSSAIIGLLFIALLVAANYIVAKRGKTWDLTDKKLYSLSQQTRDTLKELTEPVKAIVFIAGPAPESVDNLFRRYAEETDKLTFEIKDPRKNPDLTRQYNIKDVQAVAVLVRGSSAGESHTTANLGALASAEQGEQELTNALIRLNKVGEQKVYFLIGHGEWPIDPGSDNPEVVATSLQKMKGSLISDGYSAESLNLVETNAIPRDATAVVIAGAKSAFQANEKKLLQTYLEEGGRLLYFGDPQYDPGLDPLLAQYGVQLDEGMVADARVNPDQPYLVVAPFFGDHPIVNALKAAKLNLLFPMSRALTQLRGEGVLSGLAVIPLVMTSPNAWVETHVSAAPTLDMGEKSGQLPVVMGVSRESGPTNRRTSETRLVIFGTSQVLNGAWAYEPNRNLVLNALGWAANQPKKLTIRPPDRELSTMDIDEERLATIRLVSMDLLPMLLIGIGLTIWVTRRSR